MMLTFHLSEFLTPLTPLVVMMSFILGIVVGCFSVADVHARTRRFYWMAANGVVFYVPLSALRAFEGSTVAERFLATLVLWIIFSFGVYLGSWRRAS